MKYHCFRLVVDLRYNKIYNESKYWNFSSIAIRYTSRP